ncbi:MAG: Chromosomal replication initiator protein DnaA [Planctomycetota bacterium]
MTTPETESPTAGRAVPRASRSSELATLREATSTFRSALANSLGSHRYGLWFAHGTAAEAREDGIVITAANTYVAEWISKHFREAMQQAAALALGEGSSFTIEIAQNQFERDAAAVAAAESRNGSRASARSADARRSRSHAGSQSALQPTTQNGRGDSGSVEWSADRALAADHLEDVGGMNVGPLGSGSVLPRPRTAHSALGPRQARAVTLRRLEDYVIGDSNRLAFAASEQLAQGAAEAPGILFLHGECGVGKTHLLQGICRRRSEYAPRQVVRYVTAEQFTNEYIAAVRDGSLEQFRKRLRRVDLLAIDDIHFFANKSATQAEFLHTIDAIDLSGARVALVSDEHPRHIRRFSQSLVSRFLSGMVVRVERPDRGTRSELVRRLARERGLDLTTAAEDLIAGRCAGSIREIEGSITRLGALVELDGIRGQIGPGTVERLLGSEGPSTSGSVPIRLGSIVEAVCERLRVSREDLLGSGRHARTVVARGMVAHLARELTTHSFPEIARALGRDTHSAIHTAAKRLKSLVEADGRLAVSGEPIREVVDQLRHDLARGASQR